MTTTRKIYTAAFKAQLVQELLREEMPLTQLAAKHGVHPTQLRRWRDAALTAMPQNFDDEQHYQKRLAALTAQHEREKEQLYSEGGPLTTQLNWLKKKAASCGIPTEPEEISRTRKQ